MRHWKDVSLYQKDVPLDLDWSKYFDLDLLGILRCLTVRDRDNLVGYVLLFVMPHLHSSSTLWAQADMFWLDPSYREGFAGIKLFRLMEEQLKLWGVKVITVNAKLHFEAERGTIGKLFERLGYQAEEVMYSKLL